MTDLRARLREADQVVAPDLWPAIGSRAERVGTPPPEPRPAPGRAVLVAAVAFAVFAASAVLAWQALRPSSNAHRPADEVPAPSGDPWASHREGWTQLPGLPEARDGATLAWAGNELLYWGGVRSGDTGYAPTPDGYAFDPATNEWRQIPAAPIPGKNTRAIWTGSETIFWGVDEGGHTGGVAFDPATERWRIVPPSPHQSSWRGTLWGGALVWTGSELMWWGGGAPGNPENSRGAAYDPATDTWRQIADAPIGLNLASGVWTGREMIVLGSLLDSRNVASSDHALGAAYDPASDTWRQIAPWDLSPQASSAVWVGDRMVAWDYGFRSAEYLPDQDRWRQLSRVPGENGECYVRSAAVAGTVFAWDCGYAATLPPDGDTWQKLTGGLLDQTVEANGRPYPLFEDAQLVPAGDVVAVAAQGITVDQGGTPCYGCSGSPTSFWIYRPVSPQSEPSTSTDQVYLPPRLAEREGWVTFSPGPVQSGDAAVAWASTVPFADGDRFSGAAIPSVTIVFLSAADVVITVEVTPWSFDPSGAPYPYDTSVFDLRTAVRRGPEAEEPPGHYSVFEIDDQAVLVRVYFGSASPEDALIERAQRELDTLQLPPVCPASAQGGYRATLSADQGAPGDVVTITGPMPFEREDGSYDSNGDEVMIAWWNGSPDAWESLSSFSTASPFPAIPDTPIVRLGEGGRGQCSFSIAFAVPDVPPGEYPIAVLGEVPGGSTLEASLMFRVDSPGSDPS